MSTLLAFPGLQDPYLLEALRPFQNDLPKLKTYYDEALAARKGNRQEDYKRLVPQVGPILTALQYAPKPPKGYLFIISEDEKMQMRVKALSERIAFDYAAKDLPEPSIIVGHLDPHIVASYDGCVENVRNAVLSCVDVNEPLSILIGPGTPQCNFGALVLGFSMPNVSYLQVLQPKERGEEKKLVPIAFGELFERFGDVTALREQLLRTGAPAETEQLDLGGGIRACVARARKEYLSLLVADMSANGMPTVSDVAARAGVDRKTMGNYLEEAGIDLPREPGRPAKTRS
jgi:hypothetical protein